MITTQPPPDSYGPQLLATLQDAFRSVWATLYPHIGTDDEQGKELSTRLTQALMALVAAGVTDPKELRRKALEAMALNPR